MKSYICEVGGSAITGRRGFSNPLSTCLFLNIVKASLVYRHRYQGILGISTFLFVCIGMT